MEAKVTNVAKPRAPGQYLKFMEYVHDEFY